MKTDKNNIEILTVFFTFLLIILYDKVGLEINAYSLKRRIMKFFLVGLISIFPSICFSQCAVSAQEEDQVMNDKICKASMKVYFFLDKYPKNMNSLTREGYQGYQSESGYIYYCRNVPPKVYFEWEKGTGNWMYSSSTSYELEGDLLTIRTDMNIESLNISQVR